MALIPLISIGSKTAETFLSKRLSKKSKGREPLLSQRIFQEVAPARLKEQHPPKMNCFLRYKGHTPFCSSDSRTDEQVNMQKSNEREER